MAARRGAAASQVPFKHLLAEIVIDEGAVGVVLVDRVDRTDVAAEVERVDVTRAAAGAGGSTVGHRTGHVQTGLQPFLGLDVDVHTGVEALHVGTDGIALVVQVTHREVVVGLLAGAAGGNGVFLAVAQAFDGFLPVEVVRIEEFRGAVEGAVGDQLAVRHVERVVAQLADELLAGGGIGRGRRRVGAGGQEAVAHDLPFHGNILVGVEAFVFGNAADAETVVDTDVEGKPLAAALLGGDEHHAVGGAGTVQGGGSRVLQDGDRLDVIGVDVGDRSVERNAVHHIERSAVGVDGTETTDTDAAGGTRLAGCRGELHAGGNTFEGVGGIGHRADFQLLAVERSGRSGEVFLVDRTVGNDHKFFQAFRVGCQHDVDHAAAFHGSFLVEVADGAEDKNSISRHRNCVVAVCVGSGTGHGAFDLDRSERNAFAGLCISYLTADVNVLCISKKAYCKKHHAGEKEFQFPHK